MVGILVTHLATTGRMGHKSQHLYVLFGQDMTTRVIGQSFVTKNINAACVKLDKEILMPFPIHT